MEENFKKLFYVKLTKGQLGKYGWDVMISGGSAEELKKVVKQIVDVNDHMLEAYPKPEPKGKKGEDDDSEI